MMPAALFILLVVTLPITAQRQPSGDPAILPPGAKLEQIFSGGILTEGVTSAPDGTIYFSDVTFTHASNMQAGHIMKFDPKTGRVSVFRSPSGMANGLKFDAQGNAEALKLLQNTTKKDHLRVNVSGTKEGDIIHVQSLKM